MPWNFSFEPNSLDKIARTPLEKKYAEIGGFSFDVDSGAFTVYRTSGNYHSFMQTMNLYDGNIASWQYLVGRENLDELMTLKRFGEKHIGEGIFIDFPRGKALPDTKGLDGLNFTSIKFPWGDADHINAYERAKAALVDAIADNYVTNVEIDDGRDQILYGDGSKGFRLGNLIASDVIIGGKGNDTLLTLLGNDKAYGGDGADQIYGGYGNDELFGDSGDDELYGEQNSDVLRGGDGNDLLDGGLGADTMLGGAGDDVYYVDSRRDVILDQGKASDVDTVFIPVFLSYTLAANVEDATLQGSDDGNLNGNKLANQLEGNDGDNKLDGQAGSDAVTGGTGDDVINGGTGKDVLEGGAGDDIFIFADRLKAANVDRIEDFVSVDDTIQLEKDIFAVLGMGRLENSGFTIGTQAEDSSDRIIFDPNSGKLYYDRDGSGAADQVLIATIETSGTLTASDFAIV